MPRKKITYMDLPDGDLSDSDNEKELAFEAQSPIATRHHRIVTQFVEEVPVTQLDTKQPGDDDHIEPQPIAPAPVEPNEIESFLASLGGTDARYTMVIYRLPNYMKDGGRTHQNARVLCGTIEFTMDYEMEIQKRYARRSEVNIFMIVVRKNGQLYKHLPGIIVCEPPSRPDQIDIPASVAGGSVVPQIIGLPYDDHDRQSQIPPTDPLQAVDQLIQIKIKLDRAFGVVNQQPQAPASAVDPDTAILQFAMQNSAGFKERIGDAFAKKFFGDAGEKQDADPWAGVARELIVSPQGHLLVRELIDGLFRGFSGFLPQMGGSNGQTAMESKTNQEGSNGMQHESQLPQAHTENTAGTSDIPPKRIDSTPNESPESAYQRLIQEILTGLHANTDPADAIRRTDAFLIIHPSFGENIEATFSNDADTLLSVIGQIPGAEHLPALPHARQWITAFQMGFFKEEENQNGEQNPDAA